jgi:hypothetical protein
MTANDTIQFKKWSGHSLPHALVRQVWTIAEESFPPEERETCQVFLHSIENGKSILYGATRKNVVVGFTKLTRLAQSQIYLMEYLAVDQRNRNQGTGSAILHFVCQDLSRQPKAGILLEVEPPRAAQGQERQLRERRIRFYHRHGAALILDQDAYRMPNLAAAGSLWMHLMWLPVSRGCQPPVDLSLVDLFRLIFSETYPGEENDRILSQILQKIPKNNGPIQLEGCQ